MKTEHLMIAGGVTALVVGGYIYDKETGKISKLLGKDKTSGGSQVPPIKNTYVPPIKTGGSSSSSSTYTGSGITPRSSKTEIKALQNALIAAGHLAPTQKTRSGAMVSSADGIWGKMTSTALAKVGLSSPVSQAQLSSLSTGSGSSATIKIITSSDLANIASFISKELRSFTTDYGAILDKIKDKTSSQIKQIDAAYREYSANGLKKDFSSDKIYFETYNVTAIRDILNDAGLSGVQTLVGTSKTTIIADEKKGSVVVGKNLILGTAIKSKNGKTLIRTKDNVLVIANTKDLVQI